MKKDNFDMDLDLDLTEETPKEKPFSFNDLDLGLDFDLSFLDDIDESVLEEEPAPVKKPAPKAEAPVKKPAPAKKPAPVKADAPVKKAAAKKPVPAEADAPVKKPAAKKPVSPEAAAAPKKPASAKSAPKQTAAPAKKAPAAPAKKAKRGPRIGGVIFYTLYFLFILIFFVATYFGLQWLHGWLADFEYAQPTVKAQQVFQEVFTDPNWGDLYDAAGVEDSAYEGKEEYVNYMEDKMGDSSLTYMETSAGLAKDKKKYLVYLGDEKVASFTLVDKNYIDPVNLQNLEKLEDLESITNIPNWTLGAVEVFFQREGAYRIVKMDGMTAYVNGVALDETFTIQKATTKAEEYLPEGTTGFVTETQEVTGLMELPEVTVTDKAGNNIPVSYDEATRTFTARTESNTMTEEEKTLALEAAKISSLWMIEAVSDRGKVAKFFDPSSDAYNTIVKSTELWMQDYSNYRFEGDEVTDYARYSDDIFSVRVKTTLWVTRTNGTEKDYNFDQSMFFHKTESGSWLCFETTNKNVTEPVGRVRLTFKNGDNVLTTDFFDTDKKEIITPILSVPQGQVFTGWVSIAETADGSTVYNLEFQPDPETGKVVIPEGTSLKPMTLYALFEDEATAAANAAAAQAAPAETAAAEAAAETTAPATT